MTIKLQSLLIIFLLSDCQANDLLAEKISKWEAAISAEYQKKEIRKATLAAEFEAVKAMHSTKDLIAYAKTEKITPAEFFDAIDLKVWTSPECDGFAPFVLCEIVGIDATSILYLTNGDEFKLDLILKSILGIKRFTLEEIRFAPAK